MIQSQLWAKARKTTALSPQILTNFEGPFFMVEKLDYASLISTFVAKKDIRVIFK